MAKEKFDQLIADYQDIYARDEFNRGIYFECGEGWYNILRDLSEELRTLGFRKDNPDQRVIQVKEKFGTLRFYIGFGTEEQMAAIDKAEAKSAYTCEWCGRTDAVLTRHGWLRTLCPDCDTKAAAEFEERVKKSRSK